MRRSPLRLVVLTLLISVLLSGGCGQSNLRRVVEQSVSLADEITPSPPPRPPESNSDVKQAVYIDASFSMRGFVGRVKPGERTAFEDFLDSMPDVLPGVEAHKFGQPVGQQKPGQTIEEVTSRAEFDGRLHSPDFYNLQYNPDDILISGIVSRQEPRLSVIITDGVESDDQGRVNTTVVNAIRSWMEQGKLFAVLVMRSRFSGGFYSERQRRTIGSVATPDRPFYAFVFSPGQREFQDLHDKLRRRFPGLGAFVFSDDSITCKTGMPTGVDASYAHEVPPDKPYHWQMITAGDWRQDPEDPAVYTFDYSVRPDYPVRSLGVRAAASVHAWDGEQAQFRRDARPLDGELRLETIGGETSGTKFTMDPEQFFRLGSESDYSFYVISQSPYVKEVTEAVTALSTRDDSTAETVSRTYRFQELIMAVTDVHLKSRLAPRVTPKLYLTVARAR